MECLSHDYKMFKVSYSLVHTRLQTLVKVLNSRCLMLSASIIATSIGQSKLDYCNSLYYNLPQSKIDYNELKTSLARAVVNAPKFTHITPILIPLHRLKINVRFISFLLSKQK